MHSRMHSRLHFSFGYKKPFWLQPGNVNNPGNQIALRPIWCRGGVPKPTWSPERNAGGITRVETKVTWVLIAESNLLTKHDKGPLRESRTPTEISIGVYRREGRVGRENTAEQKPAAR